MFNSNGQPDFGSAYNYQQTLPSYKRVDLGLTKVFIDPKEKIRDRVSGVILRNLH